MQIRHKKTGVVLYDAYVNKLQYADLRYADLNCVNFCKAKLSNVNFMNANLRYARFYQANLYKANFQNADLQSADFCKANLYKANFQNAKLKNADFTDAFLTNANFQSATSDKYSFIGIYGVGSEKRQILFIPELDKVWCSGFSGSLDDFTTKIIKTYLKHNNKDYKEYMGAIIYFTSFIKLKT